VRITNENDLQRIKNRDPELEAKRLFFGCMRLAEHDVYSWENKYKILFKTPIDAFAINQAIELGMIPKSQLEDGLYYWGICRNARVARWVAALQEFQHMRFKSGWRVSSINHPEDEAAFEALGKTNGADIFMPWYKIEPIHTEII
jgi:hypothetical protein